MSFLSKAYNFLKGKPLANDENFYATKSKSAFPNEIYPILSEPIVHNGFPSLSRKNGKVLGEVTNRSWSVTSDRERNPQRTGLECFSPRALVKNYWTAKGEKKFNSDAQTVSNNKIINEQGEDDDEEGIFTIQVCADHLSSFPSIKLSSSFWENYVPELVYRYADSILAAQNMFFFPVC